MNTSYSNTARAMHWLVAGLIICQYVLAELADYARTDQALLKQLGLLANHKSVGMTILLIAAIRLLYRFLQPAPALPKTMPNWQQRLSNGSHFLLYALLFALPISGWLMSSATAYSVSWFNLFAFPDLIAPNETRADQLAAIHYYLGKALLILAVIHIAAALKHHFIDKDDVLGRMAGLGSWISFALVAIVSISALSQIGSKSTPTSANLNATTSSTKEDDTALAPSDLAIWQIDYESSFIKFSGDQAGAPFTGQWQSWQAQLQFHESDLSKGRFDVRIDTQTPFSNDKERDDTIRSSEFFNVSEFKEARFIANRFERNENAFLALGTLKMKNLSHPVTLNFTVEQVNGITTLEGSASLDRLLWNIGTGDWTDTSWVGQTVEVSVKVVSK